MYINKDLINDLDGYEALLYSVMLRLEEPSHLWAELSNEYLRGRIIELFESTLIEHLKRLENKGYFTVRRNGNKPPRYYFKKRGLSGDRLHIKHMEDRLLNPAERVYIAYLDDRFDSGEEKIPIADTVKVLHHDCEYNDEFKNWFEFLKWYDIVRTGDYSIRRKYQSVS